MADEFVAGWSSHGSRLSAAIEIFDNLFVVIFVDEQQAVASGCSIDKSINFIRNAEIKFKISLTDRMQVAYRVNGKTEKTILNNLSLLKKEGKINEDTLMSDNLISTKEEFERDRWKKAGESWHRKFLD